MLLSAAYRHSLRAVVHRTTHSHRSLLLTHQCRDKAPSDISRLFVPTDTEWCDSTQSRVGLELSGPLHRSQLLRTLNRFQQRLHSEPLTRQHQLDEYVCDRTFVSFRRSCTQHIDRLPAELHITLADIISGARHVDTLLPFFLRHARATFPHLECIDDLRRISDLREPAQWYPEARALGRTIVFHAGPTNSGKTYHALENFCSAASGVYCGPLKMLAVEIWEKCNERGVVCDLVTGEERRYGNGCSDTAAVAMDTAQSAANHVSCTVEMASVTAAYDVAVIDEIQMLRDMQRGWAWTRCLLGVCAREVHVCGEPAALPLVRQLAASANEQLIVHQYSRLCPLTCQSHALGSLEHLQPGDCVVCFNKSDIYNVSRAVERSGRECAVIYGSLPPGTKLSQARRFNDPADPCDILVATDAIGMGLNLSIRRIIFHSLTKPHVNAKGEREISLLGVSHVQQIAGRAGRCGGRWAEGLVTTLHAEDLEILRRLLESEPPELSAAGIHPTADQIELYAFHLPKLSLSNLVDIFVNLSTLDDSLYFLCRVESFKFLADMIEHVALPLRARYVFCCAPIDRKVPFVCNMFLKFARQYSRAECVTVDWLCAHIGWPFTTPKTIIDLVHLEQVYDVLDIYLWLSHRFHDMFPATGAVQHMQTELDAIIQTGIANIVALIRSSETGPREARARGVEAAGLAGQTSGAPDVKYGALTKRLMAQGLLSQQMMKRLHREWEKARGVDEQSESSTDM